ncbi:MAG TPA: VCBS repeat-containing protein, partial [Sphingobacteriaceae bacterium]
TEEAGVGGHDRWSRGVSVVDINHDGWQDIYVSVTLSEKPEDRRNLLYINQGKQPDGRVRFLEKAREYGLDDSSHSTMANFFDYDRDGDLDMYLVVNEIRKRENPNKFRPVIRDGSAPSTGKLYQNNWDPARKHPVFTDVSAKAGVTIEGYGHGAVTSDLNRDGWPDIYVSNDFVSNNILYINNRDGTFTDQSRTYFKHTAANSMGLDITDINNDGLSDVIELDMNPQDNYRKKMMMGANSYQTYQNFDYYGYQYQYVRNTLQVNQGPRVGENDTVGAPVFSETAFFSGIAETDWSWTPVVTDFDNDGLRDIVITNGYPRDVTDRDFMAFRDNSYSVASVEQLLQQIPVIKLHNYAYRNTGNLAFENVTENWGLSLPTFSNGAVYADLDNDGDMEMVVNNINDEALLYQNISREALHSDNHYLQLELKGDDRNPQGIGAWVEIHHGGGRQVWENTPYRGYLSSVSGTAHFGLGGITRVDSVVIRWPDRRMQVIRNVQADQRLLADIRESRKSQDDTEAGQPVVAENTLFREITSSVGLRYLHQARDIVDFNTQKLLPHKLSEYHPALAAGDINNDGTEDLVVGGSSDQPAQAFLQQRNGTFIGRNLVNGPAGPGTFLDMGLLLFDADGDGDLDLYTARGGYEIAPNSDAYQDRFFRNDGKGNFTAVAGALPVNFTSKSAVRSVDYDRDGDLDLFVAGRVEPWHYPKPVSSFILRNDTKQGVVRFTDVTRSVAPDLVAAGLVCDGLFTDFDNDGWQDLVVAGEWMPLTFLKNDQGKFRNMKDQTGVSDKKGFWNSIAPGDFDNDGDIDYVAGNHGWNTFYRASEEYPVFVTARDFDQNGSYDAIPSLFLPAQDGTMKEFP